MSRFLPVVCRKDKPSASEIRVSQWQNKPFVTFIFPVYVESLNAKAKKRLEKTSSPIEIPTRQMKEALVADFKIPFRNWRLVQ